MEDSDIVALFEQRSENAIKESNLKYHKLCYKIAWNILQNHEDCEECISDTWWSLWKYIPPEKPAILSAFISKIVRGHAIDCSRKKYAGKRVDSHLTDIEGELERLDRITGDVVHEELEKKETIQIINRFLYQLPERERNIFLMRYWYMDSIKQIAECTGNSQGSVRTILYRTRKKLEKIL